MAHIQKALLGLSASLDQEPAKARVKNTPAVATLESGLRCRVSGAADEAIHTDMPVGLGGEASAPNPGWFMRAALASCHATVIAMRAAQRRVELTRLQVTVSSETDTRGMLGTAQAIPAGMQNLRVGVEIGALAASAEELREIVQSAISRSPVGCTDLASAVVDIHVT